MQRRFFCLRTRVLGFRIWNLKSARSLLSVLCCCHPNPLTWGEGGSARRSGEESFLPGLCTPGSRTLPSLPRHSEAAHWGSADRRRCGLRLSSPPSERTADLKREGPRYLVGQIYNGQIGKGVLFIVLYIVSILLMFLVIGFVTTPIFWIWGIVDAKKSAKRINEELARQ